MMMAPSGPCLGQERDDIDDISAVRAMAETLSPALKGVTDPWRIALILRSQVHLHSVSSGDGPGQVAGVPYATTSDFSNWVEVYRASLVTRSKANECNGLAILYIVALRAYGIPARLVALYSSRVAAAPVWSHASVSVRLNGSWVAMDPTMNVSLRDDAGRLLSWREALARAKQGKLVKPQTDSEPVKSDRRWESVVSQYGYRLQDFADQALLGPWSRGPAENISMIPWDGKIEFLGSAQPWDAWASISGDFHERLAFPARGYLPE